MTTIRGFSALFAAAAMAAMALSTAAAQEPQRLRGEIEQVTGDVLTVKTHDGRTVQVILAPDYTVSHAVAIKLADIEPGTFVGVGALPAKNPDGSDGMKALQVVVFPPNTRASERHGAWSSDPAGTMTNAPASLVVAGQTDGKLTLTTGGRNYEIAVPPEAPVVRIEAGDKTLVKPGAWIGISNLANDNDKLSAKTVLVSDDKRYPSR